MIKHYRRYVVDDTTIECGPFKWVRRDSGGDEAWECVLDPSLSGLAHFCVKNYGGKPTSKEPFSGWRVVSGGPFTSAGGWTSRDMAIRGATPWLVEYYREKALQKTFEAENLLAALAEFRTALEDS